MPKFFSKSKDSNPVVPALIGIVLLLGLAAAFYLVSVPQDLRQQAASSCSEAPVNVQFRKTTEADRPWKNGSDMNLKVGDTIDINCFSKNGTSVLSGGQLLAAITQNGNFVRLTLPDQPSPESRAYTIQYPGEHIFVCTNSTRSCTDRDTFTVAGSGGNTQPPADDHDDLGTKPPADTGGGEDTKPPVDNVDPGYPPGPADEAPVPPQDGCNEIADLNQDCKVDVQDYNIFLRNFRRSFDAGK